MRVTSKGQVTVPRKVREALGIQPGTEVDFVLQEDGTCRLVKSNAPPPPRNPFRAARGAATVKMKTDEIMALTRGEE